MTDYTQLLYNFTNNILYVNTVQKELLQALVEHASPSKLNGEGAQSSLIAFTEMIRKHNS